MHLIALSALVRLVSCGFQQASPSYSVPDQSKGVSTLPGFSFLPVRFLRSMGFYGDKVDRNPDKLRSPSINHWLNLSGNPENFWIETKDGVKLDAVYIPYPNATHTVVLWGGMLGGWEGQSRVSYWFQDHVNVNTLLVSRRGQSLSEGSNIRSGEMGVYYDVQASLSYLALNQSQKLENVIVYGYW